MFVFNSLEYIVVLKMNTNYVFLPYKYKEYNVAL